MYKNKYQLMNESVVTDDDGNAYPDLATFPLNQLRLTEKPSDYKLNQNDKFVNKQRNDVRALIKNPNK